MLKNYFYDFFYVWHSIPFVDNFWRFSVRFHGIITRNSSNCVKQIFGHHAIFCIGCQWYWHKYVRRVCGLINTSQRYRDLYADFLFLETHLLFRWIYNIRVNYFKHSVCTCIQTDRLHAANRLAHKAMLDEFSEIHTCSMTHTQAKDLSFYLI